MTTQTFSNEGLLQVCDPIALLQSSSFGLDVTGLATLLMFMDGIMKIVKPASVLEAIYEIWKWHFEMKRAREEVQPAALVALPSPEAAP